MFLQSEGITSPKWLSLNIAKLFGKTVRVIDNSAVQNGAVVNEFIRYIRQISNVKTVDCVEIDSK